jgi:hypothetical protein
MSTSIHPEGTSRRTGTRFNLGSSVWSQRPSHEVFYYNPATRMTQWEFPEGGEDGGVGGAEGGDAAEGGASDGPAGAADDEEVGRCRLTVSKPVLKVPLVSAGVNQTNKTWLFIITPGFSA